MRGRLVAFWLLHALAAYPALAGDAHPVVAIIIDDLGTHDAEGRRAVGLPGPVACAVLPHTRHASALARLARAHGKEVLLHQPLQPLDRRRDPGPGALTMRMTRAEFAATVGRNLAALPPVDGVNTHMGSLLTRHPGYMNWLMLELREMELFFVDSYTTERSVALQIAGEHRIRSAKRDVFLDAEPETSQIAMQFARLKRLARERGHALAIGHPYPVTIGFLERELPKLADEGIELVSVSVLIARKTGGSTIWHASSSP